MPNDSLFPSDEPTGFQVWHKRGEGYERVASVESNALGAILMTIHGFDGHARWQDNPRVTAMPGEHRSTTIGDVLIARDGQPWEISSQGSLHLEPFGAIDRVSADSKETLKGYPRDLAEALESKEARASSPPPVTPARSHQHSGGIHLEPGKGDPTYWREVIGFDIHDATGKIGYLAGTMGGPWSDDEFRISYVEISQPGRHLTPGEWKSVMRALSDHLPDAYWISGDRTGEGGDLSPAYEKFMRLPRPAMPEAIAVPDPAHRAKFQRRDRDDDLGR
ncbi:MAG: hypothetical protein ACLQVF_26590 [Isosphaeraceae bacterium]